MDRQGEAEDDDEKIELSGDTLAALQQFYDEREKSEQKFEDLKQAAERQSANSGPLSMDMFTEDWNASQFWYSDQTARTLAQELLHEASPETRIAVISAPSVFIQVKNILNERGEADSKQTVLLEFDRRFAVFSEFVYYDFKKPVDLPDSMKGQYDRVLLDPPFLSEDCQTRAAMTVRWLSKKPIDADAPRLTICTGERMEGLVHRLYPGLRTTDFEPRHAQDRLSNDFRCYANYACGSWRLT